MGLDRVGLLAGLAATGLLAGGLVLGSRNLRNYDPVLLTYSFGVLFSAFGIAYRFAVWIRRPPTRILLRRGLLLLRGGRVASAAKAAAVNLGAHRFIRARGLLTVARRNGLDLVAGYGGANPRRLAAGHFEYNRACQFAGDHAAGGA